MTLIHTNSNEDPRTRTSLAEVFVDESSLSWWLIVDFTVGHDLLQAVLSLIRFAVAQDQTGGLSEYSDFWLFVLHGIHLLSFRDICVQPSRAQTEQDCALFSDISFRSEFAPGVGIETIPRATVSQIQCSRTNARNSLI